MKNIYIYIILGTTIFFVSCNKDNDNTGNSDYESFIVGEWVSENWDTLEILDDSYMFYNLNGKTDLYRYSISNDTFFIAPTATSSYIPAEDFWKISINEGKNQFSVKYNNEVTPICFKKLD